MPQPSDADQTRRTMLAIPTALAAATALGATSLTNGRAHAAPGPLPVVGGGLDLTRPEDFLTACVKMRGALDNDLVIGFALGRYYGLVDNELTYLFNLLAATFSLYRPRSDGGFDVRTFEIAYFTDAQTSQPLTTFLNPYTKRSVKVPQTRMGPTASVLTKDARYVSTSPSSLADTDYFLPPTVVGDDVWLTKLFRVERPSAAGSRFRYNETTISQARKSDLDNPALTRVPTLTFTQIDVNWRPWLEMGERPGHMSLRASGRRLSEVSQLPDTYLELCRRYHPDVMRDPYAFVAKDWNAETTHRGLRR